MLPRHAVIVTVIINYYFNDTTTKALFLITAVESTNTTQRFLLSRMIKDWWSKEQP
jgi:hypothetical protein